MEPAGIKSKLTGPLAVIDIGSTSIRMTVAEVDPAGTLRPIEHLQQSVSIGKDTFVKGFIEKTTIEECIRALRHFSRVLREYGLDNDRRVRVVATTAVREAANREAFRDRIHIATGWHIEILDLADTARLTYFGVQPFLDKKKFGSGDDLLIVEMGGGSTEVCYIGRGERAFSQTFAVGSLRLRHIGDNFRISLKQQHSLLEQHIKRPIEQLATLIDKKRKFTIVALGGDMRFAAAELVPNWDAVRPVALPLADLARFTDKIIMLPTETIVKKLKLAFSEAETVGPALLFYTRLTQMLDRRHVVVASTSMRDGILLEMAGFTEESGGFKNIIHASAEAIARKYHTDLAHALHVELLAERLFEALRVEHRLTARDSLLLSVAALLHDTGLFICPRNHHKHSMYLIQNSELFGLNTHDITLVSLIARYHRRSSPKPSHEEYMALDFDDRITVAKLAAILRVADALDCSHAQRIRSVACALDRDHLVLTAPGAIDVSLEEMALQNKGSLFADVYGLKPVIRQGV
jgi:exopolyphosphatase / guanosine-5'-triphosphate,3'-diphosphate pyrophosphatase